MIIITLLTTSCLAVLLTQDGLAISRNQPWLFFTLLLTPIVLFPGYLVALAWRAWRSLMDPVRGVAMLAGAIGTVAYACCVIRLSSMFLPTGRLLVLLYWAVLVLLALVTIIGIARRWSGREGRSATPAHGNAGTGIGTRGTRSLRTANMIANLVLAALFSYAAFFSTFATA